MDLSLKGSSDEESKEDRSVMRSESMQEEVEAEMTTGLSQVTVMPSEIILKGGIMVKIVIMEEKVALASPARGPTEKEMTVMRMATNDQDQTDTTEETDQAIVEKNREFQAWTTTRTLTTQRKTTSLIISNPEAP